MPWSRVFLVAAAAFAGCGSSSSHSTSLLGTKAEQDCTAVSDVLSDGPDPDADTVGYAQAQILPLQQLKVSEPALRTAIRNLVAAYQAYSTTTGAAQDQAAVQATTAQDAVNAICPGAAP